MEPTPAAAESAAPFVPEERTLPALREAARSCKGCPLWEKATQVVFGEGLETARVIFVGEQPGDQEDKQGKPFIGPAGRLFNEVLEAASIKRDDVYVTNTVKHFKWEPQGKRRIHQKPSSREVAACQPWIEAEISTIKPVVIVALGATAAQSLLDKDFRVTTDRGRLFTSRFGVPVLATMHPSSVIRTPDREVREKETARMIEDLKVVAKALEAPGGRFEVEPRPVKPVKAPRAKKVKPAG